jgi:hypothetical protein
MVCRVLAHLVLVCLCRDGARVHVILEGASRPQQSYLLLFDEAHSRIRVCIDEDAPDLPMLR